MEESKQALSIIKAIRPLGADIAFDVRFTTADVCVTVCQEGPMGRRSSFVLQFNRNANPQRIGEVVRAASAAAFPPGE